MSRSVVTIIALILIVSNPAPLITSYREGSRKLKVRNTELHIETRSMFILHFPPFPRISRASFFIQLFHLQIDVDIFLARLKVKFPENYRYRSRIEGFESKSNDRREYEIGYYGINSMH